MWCFTFRRLARRIFRRIQAVQPVKVDDLKSQVCDGIVLLLSRDQGAAIILSTNSVSLPIELVDSTTFISRYEAN